MDAITHLQFAIKCCYTKFFNAFTVTSHHPALLRSFTLIGLQERQTRATRKNAEIAPIRRAYNVVADNTGLSSFV